MTNYTPDTGEVRNAYGSHVGYCHRATKDGLAEFDRWLADVILKAREQAWGEGLLSAGLDLDYTLQIMGTNPYAEEP